MFIVPSLLKQWLMRYVGVKAMTKAAIGFRAGGEASASSHSRTTTGRHRTRCRSDRCPRAVIRDELADV
jgi:hypothetical protein